jgi:alpha-glucan,water dikinase
MASSSSTQVPPIHRYKLVEGMELQINATGFSSDCNGKVEFQLKNCSRTWILHWGCTYRGNTNWFVPANLPSGTIYKQMALQTPFVKRGDAYNIVIELRDPKIHAIEFVLKDGMHEKCQVKIKSWKFPDQVT